MRPSPNLANLRRFLLLILITEMLGIGAELVLSGHTEDIWQWAPLALMGLALPAVAWAALNRYAGRAAPVRAVQALMGLFILSGIIGTVLHYRAKAEFQMEVNPALSGAALFWEAMKSQSPPALAPGVMIQMGLLGLAWAHGRAAPAREPDE